jgi:Type I restriction enzyme R protein N terminus (HSDR_N)
MIFENYDFSKLNESDIREEIVAPLLRYLGYRSSTSANIIREQILRYPKINMGRKNVGKDPEVKGRADYICEVDNSIRWIIEAKPPQSNIAVDDIEQAYTYANHPEVRAIYFCLINGRKLQIYQTNLSPNAAPLLEVDYEQFNQDLSIIENILSPDALRRDHPRIEPDIGNPIGKGLRSIVRVTNGIVNFTKNSENLPVFNEMNLSVLGGSIQRDENRSIIASLETRTPFKSVNELNTKLGLNNLELVCEGEYLSSDPAKPNIFVETNHITFPAGDKIFNPYTWKPAVLPFNFSFKVETMAKGILTDQRFHGEFELRYHLLTTHQVIDMQGDFEMFLA